MVRRKELMTDNADVPKPSRHEWLKVRDHWYVCVKCGCLKENEMKPEGGFWRTWWHWPADGRRVLMTATPICEVGAFTNELFARASQLESEAGG